MGRWPVAIEEKEKWHYRQRQVPASKKGLTTNKNIWGKEKKEGKCGCYTGLPHLKSTFSHPQSMYRNHP